LEPIVITGKMKQKVLSLINKVASPKIDGGDVFLWNKLSDPNLHPNDYLKFEEPGNLTFTYILTTCRGVYLLNNLTNPLPMDEEVITSQVLEESGLTDTDDLEPADEVALQEISEEVLLHENLEENISEMKIHEVFSMFKSTICERRRDGICTKRHYLIGEGDVVINDKTYSGLHIYLYPDKNYNEVDVPHDEIMDELYLRFQRDKKPIPSEYVNQYLKVFSTLLAHL